MSTNKTSSLAIHSSLQTSSHVVTNVCPLALEIISTFDENMNSGSALKVKARNHVSAYFWPPYVCTKKSSKNCKKNMKLLNTI